MISRIRTPSEYIGRCLYLYFLGLSTRNVAIAMFFLHKVKRSHVAIWNWNKSISKKISSKSKRISEFIVDETLVKVGSELVWLWVAIEPKSREILALNHPRKETC